MQPASAARVDATGEGGRHYVTLLFADLSRSTEFAGAMEAEDYAALLAALRSAYRRVPGSGGRRARAGRRPAGDVRPPAREDDGAAPSKPRSSCTGRVRGCPGLPAGLQLSLHTGIHAGLVLIGAGDIERGRFELLGPVPNIASRLSDAAAPHEILVSEETLGPASRFSTPARRARCR